MTANQRVIFERCRLRVEGKSMRIPVYRYGLLSAIHRLFEHLFMVINLLHFIEIHGDDSG